MPDKEGIQLTPEDKLHIDSIAMRRLIDLLTEDEGVAEVVHENPEECARLFLAGCQAGVRALSNILDRGV